MYLGINLWQGSRRRMSLVESQREVGWCYCSASISLALVPPNRPLQMDMRQVLDPLALLEPVVDCWHFIGLF